MLPSLTTSPDGPDHTARPAGAERTRRATGGIVYGTRVPAERRWARSARDGAPALLALALSPVVAALAPGAERPLARMRGLIELERRLGLFFEPTVHAWFGARPSLMRALRLTYVAAHVPGALGVLAWTRRAHPQAFPLARDTFAATQALAAIGYVIAPTAPPRMITGLGYDDRPRPGDHGLGRSIQSPYAAMPSAHTAFSVVAAGTVWALARSRPVARSRAPVPARGRRRDHRDRRSHLARRARRAGHRGPRLRERPRSRLGTAGPRRSSEARSEASMHATSSVVPTRGHRLSWSVWRRPYSTADAPRR